MNVRKLNVSQYQKLITQLMEARLNAVKAKDFEFNIPTFIWGPPGIGKSQIIADICKKNSWDVFDLRLSQTDPSEIKGMPYIDQKTGKADFLRFESILPNPNSDTPTILLLDEFPQASDMVQSAAYQLINDRKVGDYTLPVNSVVIAAGNREDDGGVFFEMPGALKNRFDHIELDIDFDGFVKYMGSKTYDETLVAYLQYNRKADTGKIYDYKPELNNFPTFRSWEKAAKKVQYGQDFSSAISDSVGQHISVDFEVFKELTKDIPDADQLVAKSTYYEEVEKQLVACQKVGNTLLKEELRSKLSVTEKWNHFNYFIDMRNPADKADKREELTILMLTNMKEDFDTLEEVNEGFVQELAAGNINLSKEEKKDIDNVYTLIFKKWNILNEIDN